MPRLWTDTIAAHRQTVRDAVLNVTVMLTVEHGVRGVTMAQIAEAVGIGRATLYKYFTDVESVLVEWHSRRIDECLARIRDIEHPRTRVSGSARGSSRLPTLCARPAVPRPHRVSSHRTGPLQGP